MLEFKAKRHQIRIPMGIHPRALAALPRPLADDLRASKQLASPNMYP